MSTQTGSVHDETHEQFLQRASRVFSADRARAWSRMERAVFNSLLSRLIYRYGYASISDRMLQDCRRDMEKIVGLYASRSEETLAA